MTSTIPIRRKVAIPAAPEYLGTAGRTEWEAVLASVKLEGDELENLAAACRCLDVAAAYRADLLKRGYIVADRFGALGPNDSADFERRALAEYRSQKRELGLAAAEVGASRPPLGKGYR